MEAGVPIGSEAGKGYFVVDGYHLPPVMFTQDEAGALLLAGKFVEKMTDKSIREAFESAMYKIKAVLNETEKEHLENLQSYIEVYASPRTTLPGQSEFPDHFISDIQRAVVQKNVLQLDYLSNHEEQTQREVEPIGLFYMVRPGT
jgi:predicted DNA-binding transcriptional regulator YafY